MKNSRHAGRIEGTDADKGRVEVARSAWLNAWTPAKARRARRLYNRLARGK